MAGSARAAVLIAGLAVVAGMSAPVAGARSTCQDGETKTIPYNRDNGGGYAYYELYGDTGGATPCHCVCDCRG